MRRSPFTRFASKRALLAALAVLLLLPQAAMADLMLFPTRVVFEKNQRTTQIDLVNNGTEAATYRITLINRRMSESGELQPADAPLDGELFAAGMVQFSPRQITLQPGTSQAVRVMLRKRADLAPGEYRSHLQFQRMPDTKGATSAETKGGDAKEIGIFLNALVGASIPVIVRHDATGASVGLSNLELQRPAAGAPPLLALQFERTGMRSVYGDLAITFTPRGGAEQVVGRANGVAVYSPNPVRRAKLPLDLPKGLVLAQGTLRVAYRERAEAGGAMLAEGTLAVP
jgi:P pilus assembly chaperone PapD